MGDTQVGRMQFRIMQVLWDQGRANAREITQALTEIEPVAHSTVQTLLRQLEARR
jgi:predicted transcriptional regulator